MSTEERVFLYSAPGVNPGVVNIMDAIARGAISERFPPGFFKGGTHIDTRSGIRDMYKNELQASSNLTNKIENISRIDKPRLLVTYRWTNMDTKSTGLGQNPLSQYPATHLMRLDMLGYEQIFQDENQIKIYTSNLRVKIDFDVILDMRTRDDQVTALNYLYHILKFQGCQPMVGIRTKFVLPDSMIFSLYKMLYGGTITKDLVNSFANHMENRSIGNISRMFINADSNKSVYVMNRQYKRIYAQFNGEPEMSDPESKDKIYDKFSITFSGFLEVYIPTAYILRCPDVVKNNIVDPYLILSDATDDKGRTMVQYFSRIMNSKMRKNCPLIPPFYTGIIEEDFWVSDSIDITEFLPRFDNVHQYLIKLMSEQERQSIYRVDFYQDGVYLDPGIYVDKLTGPDKYMTYVLKNVDMTKIMQIVVYCNIPAFQKFWKANPLPIPNT